MLEIEQSFSFEELDARDSLRTYHGGFPVAISNTVQPTLLEYMTNII